MPSGGGVFTLQHREEGQMQREGEEGSREGEMLTFSREQRCIEAAVAAVASLPPLSASLPPSLPLPFLFSSVQTDRDEKLAADQNTPPSITACYPLHMLSPPFLSLTLSFFLLLFLCTPYFACALPRCSSSLTLFTSHLLRALLFPAFSRSPFIPPHPFLPLSLSSPLPASPHLNSHV